MFVEMLLGDEARVAGAKTTAALSGVIQFGRAP